VLRTLRSAPAQNEDYFVAAFTGHAAMGLYSNLKFEARWIAMGPTACLHQSFPGPIIYKDLTLQQPSSSVLTPHVFPVLPYIIGGQYNRPNRSTSRGVIASQFPTEPMHAPSIFPEQTMVARFYKTQRGQFYHEQGTGREGRHLHTVSP
jgi:hypothetical protein